MKQALLASIVALLIAPLSAHAEQITLLEADDFVWQTTPEGVAFSALQGDRFAESYQALVRLPGGTISPPHIKSANMFGIMLQGEMIHYANGEDPDTARVIGPGSYYSISSGLAHISACVSDEPCIAYLYHDGAFDFLPVEQ
jgi:quercetin dioxygenase-like cupin family protein